MSAPEGLQRRLTPLDRAPWSNTGRVRLVAPLAGVAWEALGGQLLGVQLEADRGGASERHEMGSEGLPRFSPVMGATGPDFDGWWQRMGTALLRHWHWIGTTLVLRWHRAHPLSSMVWHRYYRLCTAQALHRHCTRTRLVLSWQSTSTALVLHWWFTTATLAVHRIALVAVS